MRAAGISGVIAVVPAHNEAGRVGATVEAIRTLDRVEQVVVVDDGSSDGTVREANAAGARVLIAPRHRGKGGALEGALARIRPASVYLFIDGDVGSSAKEAGALVEAVLEGSADLAIGILPRDPRHGGFRIVKQLAALVIKVLGGHRVVEPLSGQRAALREVVEAVRPLAPGFGVEVGMTIDALRRGFRVVEVPVAMRHAFTGRDVQGFLHRARQGLAVLRVAASRLFRR